MAATVAEAVIVLPFIPNVTLFELEKMTVPEDAKTVPALTAAGAVDCEYAAVIWLEPDIPNVTPLEFAKTTVPVD